MFFHWMMRRLLVGPYLRLMVRATVVGRQNLPTTGPVILVFGPHRSEVESGVVSTYLARRPIHFLAKAEYWQRPGLLGRLLARVMDWIGQIPVDRSSPESFDQASWTGAGVLQRGGVLGIYPQGTRSPDDAIYKSHPSFVKSIVRSGVKVTIVPVGLVGFGSLAGSKILPGRRAHVVIKIGQPIEPSDRDWQDIHEVYMIESRQSIASSRALPGEIRRRYIELVNPSAKRITAEVTRAIVDLTGYPYVKRSLKITKPKS